MPGLITLLTDFGVESSYPAQMKGVILGRCPTATIVDLSHGVPRHDVRTAAFMLASAARAFPQGAVHVAVVDPQVGSTRRILAAEAGGHRFLAPDNGLLTLVASRGLLGGATEAGARFVSVENRSFFRTEVSSTFHGRDIFAPVGAALASGTPLEDLGPAVDEIERFLLPTAKREHETIAGEVLYTDPFGNLVTNIPSGMFADARPEDVSVHVAGALVRGISGAYSDVPAGWLLAYVGSAGLLEVAVNRQRAAARLGAHVGTPVRVMLGAT